MTHLTPTQRRALIALLVLVALLAGIGGFICTFAPNDLEVEHVRN